MDDTILVAIITIFGTAILFYLTKRHETKVKWQQEKLTRCKELLSAISELAIDDVDKDSANIKFAMSVNTISLVAPQFVISHLMNFHDYVKSSNKNQTAERHDELLKALILAIRKDIGLSKKDNSDTFNFHLIGSKPTRN